jgi:hypothetical protein
MSLAAVLEIASVVLTLDQWRQCGQSTSIAFKVFAMRPEKVIEKGELLDMRFCEPPQLRTGRSTRLSCRQPLRRICVADGGASAPASNSAVLPCQGCRRRLVAR